MLTELEEHFGNRFLAVGRNLLSFLAEGSGLLQSGVELCECTVVILLIKGGCCGIESSYYRFEILSHSKTGGNESYTKCQEKFLHSNLCLFKGFWWVGY